jgi:preprotein translocase subunit SecG
MTIVLVLVHVIVCIALIMIVLLQTGKGADMGAAFGGGASQTLFGSSGASTFLSKATTIAAIIFMVTSLCLAFFSSHRVGSSVLSDTKPPAEESAPVKAETVPVATVPVGTVPVTGNTATVPVKAETVPVATVPVTENTATVPVATVPVTENTATVPVANVPVTENTAEVPVKTEIAPAPATEASQPETPAAPETEPPASSPPAETTNQNN